MTELVWSFSPWLIFLMASRTLTFVPAIALGLAAAVVVSARAVARRQLHLLDVTGVVYFAALGLLASVAQPWDLDSWARYAQAGSHAVLTVVVFGSILLGRPFTEAYARRVTPPEEWGTIEFRAVNRKISQVWGFAFLIGTVSLLVAGSVDYRQVLLRVVVPFGALLWAYRFTQTEIARAATASAPAGATSSPSAPPSDDAHGLRRR